MQKPIQNNQSKSQSLIMIIQHTTCAKRKRKKCIPFYDLLRYRLTFFFVDAIVIGNCIICYLMLHYIRRTQFYHANGLKSIYNNLVLQNYNGMFLIKKRYDAHEWVVRDSDLFCWQTFAAILHERIDYEYFFSIYRRKFRNFWISAWNS